MPIISALKRSLQKGHKSKCEPRLHNKTHYKIQNKQIKTRNNQTIDYTKPHSKNLKCITKQNIQRSRILWISRSSKRRKIIHLLISTKSVQSIRAENKTSSQGAQQRYKGLGRFAEKRFELEEGRAGNPTVDRPLQEMKGGSVIKSIHCSRRRSKFSSQFLGWH